MDDLEKKCPFCDAENAVELLTDDAWEIPAAGFNRAYSAFGIVCYHCRQCDEKWVDAEQDKINHPRFVEARRQAEGLLSSEEIRGILNTLPYSDKEIEAALGLGPASFSRWTKGKVCQSHSKDALLIAIGEHPELLELIAQRRRVTLTGRKKGRPRTVAAASTSGTTRSRKNTTKKQGAESIHD